MKNKNIKYNNMSRKMKFKRVLLCALLISLPVLSMTNVNKAKIYTNGIDNKQVTMCYDKYDTAKFGKIDSILFAKDSLKKDSIYKSILKTRQDSIKEILIDEVDKYMRKITPRFQQSIPREIVNHSLEYGIDLSFMLAQTQLETIFGTAGAGRESSRRSLFGVAVRRYSSYQEAINDYCKLLKKSYLVKGKTEQHLMKRYTTGSGARYAGNPHYEVELTRTYNNIIRNTNIDEIQKQIQSLG